MPPRRPPDLLDPRLEVDATLAGVPGAMTAPRGWDTGRITLAEHMAYFLQRGSARLEWGNASLALAAGAAVLVPSGVEFRMRVGTGAAPTFLRCRLAIRRRGRPFAWSLRALVRHGAWELEAVVGMLIDELSSPHPAHGARLRSLATLLVTGLASEDGSAAGLDIRQRRALAALVDSHRAHGLEPRDLAERLGLTLDYFTRRFRLSFGMAPRMWLVRERVRAACVMLAEGGASLEEVARALGYGEVKLFGRQFRAVMGMPPGRWRLARGQKPEASS